MKTNGDYTTKVSGDYVTKATPRGTTSTVSSSDGKATLTVESDSATLAFNGGGQIKFTRGCQLKNVAASGGQSVSAAWLGNGPLPEKVEIDGQFLIQPAEKETAAPKSRAWLDRFTDFFK